MGLQRDILVYRANATESKPLCVAPKYGEWSLTIWLNEDGDILGSLFHTFENDEVKEVVGDGLIPASYVAMEENLRIR